MAPVLGLGGLASGLFLLGLSGRFTAGALTGLAVVAALLAARPLARAIAGGREPRRAAALWTLAGLGPLLLALYPPTAWDATLYHLPLARRLVETGGFGMADNLRFPVFPLLAETLFASGLALADARAAQLVSAVATLATAGVLAAWGRERFGASALAHLPAALWLGHPIVVYASGTAYVEPLLAMFATAAWYAFDRWRRDPAPGWLIVAGLCVGWAAATKYLALPLAVLLGGAVLATASSARWRALFRFGAGFVAAAAPWYLLIWVFTDNPVFPFLSGIFGGSEWSFSSSLGLDGIGRGLGDRGLAVLRFCWDAVLERDRVNQQPPYSPLLLLAIPSGIWAAARAAWSRPLVVALGLALAGFAWLPADSRYLLGIAPLLGMVLAVPARDLLARWGPVAAPERRRWGIGLVLLTLLPGPAYAVYCVFRQGPPPSGPLATDAYLRRELPLYAAVERVNRRDGGEAALYGLHAERMIFWSSGRQIGDWNGPFRYGLVEPLLGRPDRLWRQLRGFGAGYLLVPDRDRPALARGPGLDARFREIYEDDQALVLELRAAPAPAPGARR